jgi:hypothetical protein
MKNNKKEQLNIHFPAQVKFVLNVAANLKGISKSQLAVRFVWDGAVAYLRNLGVFGNLPKTYEGGRGERWLSEEELFGGGTIKPANEPEEEPDEEPGEEPEEEEDFDDPLVPTIT